jgi:hypothetical protein
MLGLDRPRVIRHALVLGLDRPRDTRHTLMLGLDERAQHGKLGFKSGYARITLALQLLDRFLEMGNGRSDFLLNEIDTVLQIATYIAHGSPHITTFVILAPKELGGNASEPISVHRFQGSDNRPSLAFFGWGVCSMSYCA